VRIFALRLRCLLSMMEDIKMLWAFFASHDSVRGVEMLLILHYSINNNYEKMLFGRKDEIFLFVTERRACMSPQS
jgi:hypothetical protein